MRRYRIIRLTLAGLAALVLLAGQRGAEGVRAQSHLVVSAGGPYTGTAATPIAMTGSSSGAASGATTTNSGTSAMAAAPPVKW